ncbi:transcription antitermination factor NusB [Sporolactobacillus sp. Y61]|jgi:N utilization substance protein B|uniref:Transcription antitermination protein NusB n=1 Tax=Sporolactobacillus sp. Y61 TaxID=3160863 RepID=A0AAU8IDV6_9BACL|nr:transcription antitermination factor NusB [Sporolactobacillus sp. THM19-2]RYL87848.1 transcription antitermination factor NusB [Sporolactobacillus sp. THM19-2]
MNRRQARETALKVLFQMEVSGTERSTAVRAVNENDIPLDPFVNQLLDKTLNHLNDIDSIISKNLVNWSFDRLGNMDRTILRLAVCELRYFDDIPDTVTINEAVELCRTYSDEQSRRFVNGILSHISKE